jgi:hypothetical protein
MRIADAVVRHMTKHVFCSVSFCFILGGMASCAGFSSERLVYNQADARIGIQTDPTIARSHQPVSNAHPASVTTEEMRALLGAVQISGWSGTIAGIFEAPRFIPFLTDEQLKSFSGPLSNALGQAEPSERVMFSFPKPGVAYSEDRTSGALFFRGRYLHLVVTDHYSVIQTDNAGEDLRDIRDTKGLKLSIARPAVEAIVPDVDEPRWAPFETVHISMNVKEVLASRSEAPSFRMSGGVGKAPPVPGDMGTSRQDLQNQIRELTNSNLELRERLDDQKNQMKGLTEEMNRLRHELDQVKPAKPSPRKNPSP